jgi:hypothetical protein
MSAKSAVTVLRSPSGGISLSAGNCAARGSAAEPLEGGSAKRGGALSTEFELWGFSARHFAQILTSCAAQLPQNFMVAGLSRPHREQIIVGRRRGISIAAARTNQVYHAGAIIR